MRSRMPRSAACKGAKGRRAHRDGYPLGAWGNSYAKACSVAGQGLDYSALLALFSSMLSSIPICRIMSCSDGRAGQGLLGWALYRNTRVRDVATPPPSPPAAETKRRRRPLRWRPGSDHRRATTPRPPPFRALPRGLRPSGISGALASGGLARGGRPSGSPSAPRPRRGGLRRLRQTQTGVMAKAGAFRGG